MDALAGAVLSHVMGRGALPVFVATTPTGPLQAERVLRQIGAESGRIFSARQDYVNLGFLPGGAMGLAGFVQDPLGALPLETSLGQPARDVPALQSVNSLAGFQMIVVATESPERARSWVEQIETQAAAGARPALLMVVSAQADPLVRPYYAAQPQQVQGLVSGLTGGLAYAEASAQSGSAQAYWPAFNAGLLVAVVLMLFGGVASLISGRLAKRNAPQEGEAA
jgi:hypothetical protein